MFKKTNEIKKNKSKKENKNKVTVKVYKRPVFLIAGLISLIAVTIAIYVIFLNFKEIMRIEYDGYAISGKEITENLLGNSSEENKNLSLIPVKEQEKLYKKLNSYFIGENKKDEINLEYPIYINNNSTMYNLSQNMMLITNEFEELAGYRNLTATNGAIYNENDLERVDSIEYIFLKNEDNIYTNLKEVRITTVAKEYRIPLNSSIYFDKEAIRYYEVKDNKLIYKEIGDIDSNSKVQIGDKEVSYQELLTKLKILKEEKQNQDIEEEIIKEDTSKENQTKNEEIKKEENEETNKEKEKEEVVEGKYIKPEVNCSPFEAKVYTMSTVLTIQDPSKVIQGAITFEIKRDGKVYLRKTYTSAGEIQIVGLEPNTNYEIEGKYIYLNEQRQKVENTFYRGIATTKGLQELKPITLSYENGEIFASKIQIAKLKISSSITDEAVKGVKRAEIVIENASYEIKNEKLKQMIAGQEAQVETSESLKSNQKISYEIKFYDKQGNEIKLENNKGETKTAKQKPSVSIRIAKQNVIDVTLGTKLNNRDKVEIQNYRYVITKPNGDIVKESGLKESDSEIFLNDLDPNQYYSIKIYGDYDVNDNKGLKENQILGETIFATQPLSTLGYVNLEVGQQDVTTNSGKIGVKIEEEKTDKRLIQILKELKIQIINKGKNDLNIERKENEIISEIIVEGEELQNLKQGDSREESYENLESNTKYEIKITAKVSLGETIEEVQTTYDLREFITLKKPAEIQMRNLFVTGDMIDFDVRIEDIDNASLTSEVRMELRDEKQNLVKLEYIDTNKEYTRKTFEKLELNKTYTLSFYADQYNEGSTDSTYKANYLLKQMEIYTETGITGNIGLTDLVRKATGKNLVDMSSEIKWYVYPNFNTDAYYGKEYDERTKILTLGGHGNHRRAVYDLKEYAGQTVTMSFKAKLVEEGSNGNTNYAYIQNKKTDGNRTKIEGLTTEKWKEYSYTMQLDDSGYLGFYIQEGNGIEIQELQIELGEKKTSYEEFEYVLQANISVTLEDKRNEIPNNDYYIKIYENDTVVQENRYEEIGENNIIADVIKSYEVKENNKYKVELIVKINQREYVLDVQEFSCSSKEIKGISTVEEYYEIQPNGNYIVLNELDFRNEDQSFGSNNMGFKGEIDYNGKTIKFLFKDRAMFQKIEIGATLQNLVLDIYLPKNGLDGYADGALFSKNYGTIQNLKVNLVECYNAVNERVYILGWENDGIIDRFSINLQVPLYSNTDNGIIYNSYGTIKNGYIYGENIENDREIASNGAYTAFLKTNESNGILKNVYSLISVKDMEQEGREYQEANFVINNKGKVENIYSVGINKESSVKRGPNILNDSGKVSNSFYFYDTIFSSSCDIKLSNLALHDRNFHNQVLNPENAFQIEEFVDRGFYPQLNWPDCMPIQDYIELPDIVDKDLPDITSTEIIESTNNSAKIKFGVNNIYGETITNIDIKNVKCEILSQNYSEGRSEVIVLIEKPIQYVSSYDIIEISTKGSYNMTYTRIYKTGERRLYVDFYREIHSINEWKEINRYPTENYILSEDLNFINESNNISITNYKGKLNGNNHTISNIKVSENYVGLIQNLSGTVKDLNIKNYNYTSKINGCIGIIGIATNAKINDVHIVDMNIMCNSEKEVIIGGIVGAGNNTMIENSSITNLQINYQTEIDKIEVGGIIGRGTNTLIENCFVLDSNINIGKALTCNGIGGIAGNISGSIKYCYTTGEIKGNKEYIGGIAGYTTTEVSNCYSLINIQTQGKYAGGIVGFSKHSKGDIKRDNPISYNLYLGNIYSNLGEIESRISGNNAQGNGNVRMDRTEDKWRNKRKREWRNLTDKTRNF